MNWRRVERLTAENTWEEITFDELKAGDCFKLYDDGGGIEDGTIVYLAKGDAELCAVPEGFDSPEGNYMVEADYADEHSVRI